MQGETEPVEAFAEDRMNVPRGTSTWASRSTEDGLLEIAHAGILAAGLGRQLLPRDQRRGPLASVEGEDPAYQPVVEVDRQRPGVDVLQVPERP